MDGRLQIDLTDYIGGTGTHVLVSVYALDGVFDDIKVFGLDAGLNARTVINYLDDTVSLKIANGNGTLTSETVGSAGVRGSAA